MYAKLTGWKIGPRPKTVILNNNNNKNNNKRFKTLSLSLCLTVWLSVSVSLSRTRASARLCVLLFADFVDDALDLQLAEVSWLVFHCEGIDLGLSVISLSGTEHQYFIFYSEKELQPTDARHIVISALKATVPYVWTLQLSRIFGLQLETGAEHSPV